MTVQELIEMLEGYDDEQEVRLMTQPNYPFEYSIGGVVSTHDVIDNTADDDIVYITEGSQLGYGNKEVFDY